MDEQNAVYQISIKVLLKKEKEFLFLKNESGDKLDLPGGRIRESDKDIALEKILGREIKEELGNIKYKLNKPAFYYRRFFKDFKVFIIVYEADLMSMAIRLSREHSSYAWINPEKYKFKPLEFFGKEEYLAFKKYFNK
ncbi:NUDIX hydrolase [Patescibacteria group bacterium]|nr:NUDIX hydrolase [Patescibacteria group bacterium]MBU4353582.1 NUDIX hydrolase [Patescibacteria group bacterium]MBU4476910.1 NUDIX hydrolase [Patescibacteria group bacterium]MCG2699070.1 NUDIX hydrolase [Candidatus Parcubacteria bacterium]